MEENGTYGASGVVWCRFIIFSFSFFSIGDVRWLMCMGRRVREGVCSHAYILKGFQMFYSVRYFVIGRLLWLIFRGGIFLCFVVGRCWF